MSVEREMYLGSGRIVAGAKWLEQNLLPICQQGGPIVLAIISVWIGVWFPDVQAAYKELPNDERVWSFWLSMWTPWLFLFSSVVAIYGGIGGAADGRKKDELISEQRTEIENLRPLRDELEEAQQSIDYLTIQQEELVYKVTSDYLGHLASDHLDFNDSERISLYLHDSPRGRFILAGRFSKNSDFLKINRKAFSDGEGCIGQTWKNGGRYFAELPQVSEEYYEYLKNNLQIDRKTARSLRMKSIAYCSFAIEENYRRIGIVLFESTKHGVLVEANLDKIASEHRSYLVEMLKKTRDVNSLIAHQAEAKGNV